MYIQEVMMQIIDLCFFVSLIVEKHVVIFEL